MKNSDLVAAKRAKRDEFYTSREDIERELVHYASHFRDKVVYCNCDDPDSSEFWKFFQRNFGAWGLKRLIATHYEPDAANYSYMLEMNPGDAWDGTPVRYPLQSNGDFRSAACIELLEQADIIVTNPPFSLFREYVAQLFAYDKKFLIIGNINAVTYKEFFRLFGMTECGLAPAFIQATESSMFRMTIPWMPRPAASMRLAGILSGSRVFDGLRTWMFRHGMNRWIYAVCIMTRRNIRDMIIMMPLKSAGFWIFRVIMTVLWACLLRFWTSIVRSSLRYWATVGIMTDRIRQTILTT